MLNLFTLIARSRSSQDSEPTSQPARRNAQDQSLLNLPGLLGLLQRLLPVPLTLWLIKKKKLDWKIRAALYQHLVDQVGNDIALDTALNHFRNRLLRANKEDYAKLVALISQQLKNGYKFSQTLEGLVSNEEVAIIAAGELSGKLPFALSLVLEQHERTNRLKKTIRQGLSSTLGHLLIACAVLWYLAASAIPSLTQAIPASKARGLVAFLFVASDFVHSIWMLIIPTLFVSAIGVMFWSLPRWTGRSRLLAEHYFPFSYYRDLMGYQWLMVFATLLSAGIADVQILEMQAKGASPYLRERITLLYQRLRTGGMSLGEALILPIKRSGQTGSAHKVWLGQRGRQGAPRGLAMNFPSPDINESIVALYGFANFPQRITKLISTWALQIEDQTLALVKLVSEVLAIATMLLVTLLLLAIQDLGSQIGSVAGS